ncbi:helix-turn-helix transcriptional regulator [Bosea sp. CRIB-10]|uniref:helix-turn-helix domain-containing protein n=1 Tax=Bosea sp. CRIB-10 TaxID=378404 RepID=UPI000B83F5A3|nr:helix-turn-helix transcriptional regulator [Bosea sp. CRIB-10]
MINGPQLRAARAWLNLSQDQVAEITGVAKRTIARIESEATVPHDRTLRDIQSVLEALGVEFLVEGGVGTGIRVVKKPDR